MSVNAVTRHKIAQWSAACGVRIEPWEARAIRLIDNEFFAAQEPKKEAKK